jgi:hypothetical protein
MKEKSLSSQNPLSKKDFELVDNYKYHTDRENLKINMLDYVNKKTFIKMPYKDQIKHQMSGSQKTVKGGISRTDRIMHLRRVLQEKEKNNSNCDYSNTENKNPKFESISKNLKSLQKNINTDHMQNYNSINSRLNKISSAFQRVKGVNLKKKLAVMSSKKKLKPRHVNRERESSSKVSYSKHEKLTENYKSNTVKLQFSKKKYSNSNFKSSFNKNTQFLSPTNKNFHHKSTYTNFKASKKLENKKPNISIDCNVRNNYLVKDSWKNKNKKEIKVKEKFIKEKSVSKDVMQTDFSLSIHENEEISIHSVKKNQLFV